MTITFEYNSVTYNDGDRIVLPTQAAGSVTADTITIRATSATTISSIVVGQNGVRNSGYFLVVDDDGSPFSAMAANDTHDFDVLVTERRLGQGAELGHYFQWITVTADTGTYYLFLQKTVTDSGFTAPTFTQTEFYRDRLFGYFTFVGSSANEFNLPAEVISNGHAGYVENVITPWIDWVGGACNVHCHVMAGKAGSSQAGGDFCLDGPVFLKADASEQKLYATLDVCLRDLDGNANVNSVCVYLGSHRQSQAILDAMDADDEATSDWPEFFRRYGQSARHALVCGKLSHLAIDAVETRAADVSASNPASAVGEARYEATNAYRRVLDTRGVETLVEPLVETTSPYAYSNGFGVWAKYSRLEFTLGDHDGANAISSGTFPTAANLANTTVIVIVSGLWQNDPEVYARGVAHVIALAEFYSHPGFLIDVSYPIMTDGGMTSTEFYNEVVTALGELEG